MKLLKKSIAATEAKMTTPLQPSLLGGLIRENDKLKTHNGEVITNKKKALIIANLISNNTNGLKIMLKIILTLGSNDFNTYIYK